MKFLFKEPYKNPCFVDEGEFSLLKKSKSYLMAVILIPFCCKLYKVDRGPAAAWLQRWWMNSRSALTTPPMPTVCPHILIPLHFIFIFYYKQLIKSDKKGFRTEFVPLQAKSGSLKMRLKSPVAMQPCLAPAAGEQLFSWGMNIKWKLLCCKASFSPFKWCKCGKRLRPLALKVWTSSLSGAVKWCSFLADTLLIF